jgi:KDO2-lipid IV(A) lauroyltransferase
MAPSPVLVYRAGAAVAHRLPGTVVGTVASTVAVALSRRRPELRARREMVARHMRRACDWPPERVLVGGVEANGTGVHARALPVADDAGGWDSARLEGAVDAAFASYARYWAESLRLPGMSPAAIDAGMSWEGIGRITRAVADGRGAILALPHLGSWEWGGFWMVQQGFALTVVVEALEPPELFEWFAHFRRSLGMEVVAVGPGAAMAVARALRAGGVVCLLCDRNVGQSGGIPVEFFGEGTELPAGPATLALRTGAALLPCAVYFDGRGDRHLAVVRPEIVPDPSAARPGIRAEVGRLTQALAHELEVLIRRAPTQWHLMQPNWPSDPGYRH